MTAETICLVHLGAPVLAQGLTHSRCSVNRKYTQSVDLRPRSKDMENMYENFRHTEMMILKHTHKKLEGC